MFAGKILVECCQEVAARNKSQPGSQGSQVSSVGYEDIGEAAYGGFGRKLVSTAMYTEIVGICSLLFVVEVSLWSLAGSVSYLLVLSLLR